MTTKTNRTMKRVSGLAAAPAAGVLLLAAYDGALADDTWMKDLHIAQRAMAEIGAAPATAQGRAPAAGELSVRAALDRADGLYDQGDTLRLTVDTSEDAYVWVFDTGTSGKVHQLFPNSYDDDNFVRADAPLTLPPADSEYDIVVSHPPGAELITVVASRDDMLLARDAIDGDAAAGPFFALRGSSASVAKDLNISLRERPADYATAHRVVHIR